MYVDTHNINIKVQDHVLDILNILFLPLSSYRPLALLLKLCTSVFAFSRWADYFLVIWLEGLKGAYVQFHFDIPYRILSVFS